MDDKVIGVDYINIIDPFTEFTIPIPLSFATPLTKGVYKADLNRLFPNAAAIYVIDENNKNSKKYMNELHMGQFFAHEDTDPAAFLHLPHFVDMIPSSHIIGMCLSGGGFRATLFHVGSMNRMNDLKMLQNVNTFSSVSGGSLNSAILALAWDDLVRNEFSAAAYDFFVREPLVRISKYNFAWQILVQQKFNPGMALRRMRGETTCNFLAELYEQAEREVKESIIQDFQDVLHTFKWDDNTKPSLKIGFGLPLKQALPDPTELDSNGNSKYPFFVFCGTDLRSGKPFYFSHQNVGDLYSRYYHYEEILPRFNMPPEEGKSLTQSIKLSEAVAASSSFPLAFQPFRVPYVRNDDKKEFIVSDGGVYDNLGIDVVLRANEHVKRSGRVGFLNHSYVLVSNAGAPFIMDENILFGFANPLSSTFRAIGIIGEQIDRLRRHAFNANNTQQGYPQPFWQLDDVWNYYDYALRLHINEKSCENLSTQLMKSQCTTVFTPLDDDIPNILSLLDLYSPDIIVSDEKFKRAERIAKLITSVRTDLNCFLDDECVCIEALGYIISAAKIADCPVPGVPLLVDSQNNTARYSNINADFIEKSLKNSAKMFGSLSTFLRSNYSMKHLWKKLTASVFGSFAMSSTVIFLMFCSGFIAKYVIKIKS